MSLPLGIVFNPVYYIFAGMVLLNETGLCDFSLWRFALLVLLISFAFWLLDIYCIFGKLPFIG